ncbi:PTS lactose/cellobiose transporter subunit IIA [Mycoplasma sp. NEAQ87857]|uniref:PTS lactose/cellobiose transporter subunit IIA n=1 Tax=Mycoplasma sp. NEAQ87857 TaxID=2683967 RepID=UPI001319AA79|nr:PTS lactose/cellobiose transporter subunit IIA [Mycoplasma sp. NEAQ87857]QGZ97523.1 PTS lactose/cellobiose transporter subunit IIA [Mycoplasma sp. NEAQ87857]
MEKNKIELACFEIIAYSGEAKALFLEAYDCALELNYDLANSKIKEGKTLLNKTHQAHMELLTIEAQEEKSNISLLLVHAEDQFMSAENALIMAEKMLLFIKKFESKLT